MSQPKGKLTSVKEYVVRVPNKSRKNYHMMRFHTANGIDFKSWAGAKMERENNLKEYKIAIEDMPRYGAGSEFGREQRDEARRKKHGIRVKKYKADDQPWLLSLKDKTTAPPPGKSSAPDKKFKGIREGGVSDNVSWYVFLQAKDGAFEAYPVEEWYNFQPINRYKCLNAEEAEVEFEKRDKIRNYFSVMYQKKLRKEDDDADGEDEGKKKGSNISKALLLSEMDDWMSDRESDDSDSDDGGEKKTKSKGKKKPVGKKKKSGHRGVKKKRKEDGQDGTDCEEESDDYNDGAEHEYMSEDSSDSEQENDEKVTKDLKGVDEDQGLKKLLNSDEEDEEEDKKDDEDKSDDEEKKNKKPDSSPEFSDSSDEEKVKSKGKDSKKGAGTTERASESIKRKIVSSEGSLPGAKKARGESPNSKTQTELPGESSMFEEQIRRYLLRKPMNTTEILQKLKSKKTGHSSEQLVQIIAVMLKKINPQKQRVQGKMYLSLKEK